MPESAPNRISWITQGYIASLCLIAGIAGFLVGHVRGEAFGERTKVVTVTETVQYPPAYAGTCATMIEAAWSLRGDGMPPSAPDPTASPHQP